MSLNDTLSNALSVILNAEKKGKRECIVMPISKLIRKVLSLMKDKGYIGDFNEVEYSKGNYLKVNLLGRINKCGAIKPRFSVTKKDYEKFEKRNLLAKDFGFIIISKSKGIITHNEAKAKGYGGKLIAYIY